ncbi:MAG: nucleotidyltransferase [candidate division Zixibacteria bacterium]|nr:nucleotidyltransferase [Gammaproteobacteria bacterium]NIX59530.1 nucleotidyltransferase [candidate division Zixibacteria bacterium]
MSEKTLTVVIPMAGFGTRLRPHTWSKPKPLVQIAGKTVLDHVLGIISTATDLQNCRLAFIIGYLGDQIKTHMDQYYPDVETSYYVQEEMLGQTHAIAMAREQIEGPTLVLFSDTIVHDDLSFLLDPGHQEDGVIWVKQVEDPRRFGVVDVGDDGYIQDIIEKPDSMENDLAVVGYYYFSRGEDLMAAIDHQLNQKMINKGEYYIADAMKLMIDRGAKLKPKAVNVWLDAGVPDTVLETNRYLLEKHSVDNVLAELPADVEIIPPVNIDPSAQIRHSKIGPHTSIGPGCRVEESQITNSVIETDAVVVSSHLNGSLVGERAQISGINGTLIVGDDSIAKCDT